MANRLPVGNNSASKAINYFKAATRTAWRTLSNPGSALLWLRLDFASDNSVNATTVPFQPLCSARSAKSLKTGASASSHSLMYCGSIEVDLGLEIRMDGPGKDTHHKNTGEMMVKRMKSWKWHQDHSAGYRGFFLCELSQFQLYSASAFTIAVPNSAFGPSCAFGGICDETVNRADFANSANFSALGNAK